MQSSRRRHGRTALWISAGIALGAGCASDRNPHAIAVPPPGPSSRPHAPGLAVDRVVALPKAAESATADHGIVVLTEPVDTRAARRVVEAFFAAIVDEALDDLGVLCEASATQIGSRSRKERLVASWQRRFERLDYRSLSTEVFYRPSEMEIHTARDAAAVRSFRFLPAPPKGAEVLIRTPIVGANASRLFGGDLVFLLKPGGAGYKIAEVFEDFRLP